MTRTLAQIKTDAGTVTFDVDDADIIRTGPERVSRKRPNHRRRTRPIPRGVGALETPRAV